MQAMQGDSWASAVRLVVFSQPCDVSWAFSPPRISLLPLGIKTYELSISIFLTLNIFWMMLNFAFHDWSIFYCPVYVLRIYISVDYATWTTPSLFSACVWNHYRTSRNRWRLIWLSEDWGRHRHSWRMHYLSCLSQKQRRMLWYNHSW